MRTTALSRRHFLALSAGAGATAGGLLLGAPAARADDRTARALPTTGFNTSHLGDYRNDRLSVVVRRGVRVLRTQSLPAFHAVDPAYAYVAPPTAQDLTFRVTTTPRLAERPTEVVTGYTLGVHYDSVTLETATAGYFGTFLGPWNEVPGALDRYGAHTHPVGDDLSEGDYHYHRPSAAWKSSTTAHSPLIGWAADGFPVYLRAGYADPSRAGAVRLLRSGFRVRSGPRPTGAGSPGGTYDGTYVADYEYVPGLGDLDRCNGRLCVTPEFPGGIYAYFLTDQWPWIPHWLRGTPDATFTPQDNGSQGPPSGPPPGAPGAGPAPG
jgi:hypothetical protein